MTSTLVDTNVLIDILGSGSPHREWSVEALKSCFLQGDLVLSSIVYSELAASPLAVDQIESALSWLRMRKETVSFETAFRAGKAHRQYRLSGGQRDRTLPDFLIGAQAELGNHRLLTRDRARYQTYFPTIDIIAPDTHPKQEQTP